MDAELQTRVSLPVVLVNREGLYVIVAVLGVSILGCAGVLTYSFSNYTKLKRNADEVRAYIASRAKAAGDQLGAGKQAAADVVRSATAGANMLAVAESDHVVDTRLPTSSGVSKGRSANDTFVLVASQEMTAIETAVSDSRLQNMVKGSDSGNAAATGTDAVGVADQG